MNQILSRDIRAARHRVQEVSSSKDFRRRTLAAAGEELDQEVPSSSAAPEGPVVFFLTLERVVIGYTVKSGLVTVISARAATEEDLAVA